MKNKNDNEKRSVFVATLFITIVLSIVVLSLIIYFRRLEGIKPQIPSGDYISFSTLWENREEYVNQEVTVLGLVVEYHVVCTKIACSELNPCCNSCHGSLYLIGSSEMGDRKPYNIDVYGFKLAGIEGCKGNNCERTCPLERNVAYIITGTVKKDMSEKYFLEVSSSSKDAI